METRVADANAVWGASTQARQALATGRVADPQRQRQPVALADGGRGAGAGRRVDRARVRPEPQSRILVLGGRRLRSDLAVVGAPLVVAAPARDPLLDGRVCAGCASLP